MSHIADYSNLNKSYGKIQGIMQRNLSQENIDDFFIKLRLDKKKLKERRYKRWKKQKMQIQKELAEDENDISIETGKVKELSNCDSSQGRSIVANEQSITQNKTELSCISSNELEEEKDDNKSRRGSNSNRGINLHNVMDQINSI